MYRMLLLQELEALLVLCDVREAGLKRLIQDPETASEARIDAISQESEIYMERAAILQTIAALGGGSGRRAKGE